MSQTATPHDNKDRSSIVEFLNAAKKRHIHNTTKLKGVQRTNRCSSCRRVVYTVYLRSAGGAELLIPLAFVGSAWSELWPDPRDAEAAAMSQDVGAGLSQLALGTSSAVAKTGSRDMMI